MFILLNVKTVLFQTIQFSISMQFSSIWLIERTLSGAITLGQNEPGNDGNEGVLRIPKSWNLTIMLFSVISRTLIGGVLLLCRVAVGVFYNPSRLGNQARRRGRICFSPRSKMCLHTDHQPKQTTWNSTELSSGPSTVNNHCCSLIQTALFRANFRKSSDDPSGLLTTTLCRYHQTILQQTVPAPAHVLHFNPAAILVQPSNNICTNLVHEWPHSSD